MKLLIPWSEDSSDVLVSELHREVPKGHLLYNVPVSVLARRQDKDDVLFELNDGTGRVAVVHLTWQVENNPAWPEVTLFPNLELWLNEMRKDHTEFNA